MSHLRMQINKISYLMTAAKIPNVRMIQLILKYKADPHVCDKVFFYMVFNYLLNYEFSQEKMLCFIV